jgi:hypothetical protein
MEGIVKGVGVAAAVAVGGQAMTTEITLIYAGQPSRCRMTVSRPPSWPQTFGVGRNHKRSARVLGNSVCPDRDRCCHSPGHAAVDASGTN